MSFAFDKDSSPQQLMDELEKFLVFWFGPHRPEYGVPAEILAKHRLPEPLRRLHAFAGRWPHPHQKQGLIFSNQDHLIPLEQMRTLPRNGRIEFLMENQGVWSCVTEPEGDDPPVYKSFEGGPWKKVAESLTRTLVTFCLQEAALGARLVRTDEHVKRLYESEPTLARPIWLDGPLAGGKQSIYLYRERILALHMGWNTPFIATNDDEAMRFLKQHQGELCEINIDLSTSEWSSFSLDIHPDGSGEFVVSGTHARATVPAGTFDFARLSSRLGSDYDDRVNGRCRPGVFLRRAGQSPTTAIYPHDLELLCQQFEAGWERAADKSPDLQPYYDQTVPRLRDLASGKLEQQWRTAASPSWLLGELDSHSLKARRSWLLAAALCWRLHDQIEERQRRLLYLLENEEDEPLHLDVDTGEEPDPRFRERSLRFHTQAALWHAGRSRHGSLSTVCDHAANARAFAAGNTGSNEWHDAFAAEQLAQTQLIRDIVRSPFGESVRLNAGWLNWREGTVGKLARAAYLERLPNGQLDSQRLAILADALEEAGCNEQELLAHLRGPGPHVRGCWALDVLLDKE